MITWRNLCCRGPDRAGPLSVARHGAALNTIVNMMASRLATSVWAVRPPYVPAVTPAPESVSSDPKRVVPDVSLMVSRVVTPAGAVHDVPVSVLSPQ